MARESENQWGSGAVWSRKWGKKVGVGKKTCFSLFPKLGGESGGRGIRKWG